MIKYGLNADKLPNDKELEKADQNIIAATFRWLLMRGIRPDPTKEPKDLVTQINRKKIYDDWKEAMDINVPIRICGLCGIQDIMTKNEYDTICIANLSNIWKADKKEIPPKNSVAYEARHLVQIGDDIFKLVKEGIEGDQITLCNTCA
eukprot:201603_1